MAKVKRTFWKILVATGFASCLAMLLQGCGKKPKAINSEFTKAGKIEEVPAKAICSSSASTNAPSKMPIVPQGDIVPKPQSPAK